MEYTCRNITNYLLLLIICLVGQSYVYSQSYIIEDATISKKDRDSCLTYVHPISSIKLYSTDSINFSECLIITDSSSYTPHKNEYTSSDTAWSHLIVFSSPQKFVHIQKPTNISVSARSIYVQPLQLNNTHNSKQFLGESCASLPHIIYQDEWRVGLPEPDYTRIRTETKHIIIHHSAGSNNQTNYTDIIRNIYIDHTTNNGWDDIGYNYLIAQNGAIYAGRDPGDYEQDMVQGAHFVGKNAHTLGICILGNYEEVPVPDTAYQLLQKLVSWKCGKDSLQPLLTAYHPANSNLPVIAGHRDGGATLCPGEHLYEILPILRNEVADSLRQCGYTIATELSNISTQKHASRTYSISPKDLCYVYSINGQLITIDIFARIKAYTHNQRYIVVPQKFIAE
ncbi:MAG: N-acetylmuramoyl-L-alanine amidase [Bacteroidales bacterium]